MNRMSDPDSDAPDKIYAASFCSNDRGRRRERPERREAGQFALAATDTVNGSGAKGEAAGQRQRAHFGSCRMAKRFRQSKVLPSGTRCLTSGLHRLQHGACLSRGRRVRRSGRSLHVLECRGIPDRITAQAACRRQRRGDIFRPSFDSISGSSRQSTRSYSLAGHRSNSLTRVRQ